MTQSNDKNSNVVSSSEPRKVINFSEEERSKMTSIKELVTKGKEETKAPVQTEKPKIQKVPMVLRDHKNFAKFYEPKAVSIGPIHHKNVKLQLDQQHKPRLVAEFIKESGKTTEELYEKIKAEMEALKLLFDPEVIKDYKDEELSWMLFLDGCSTLQFIQTIYCIDSEKKMREYNIKSSQVAFAQRDLFLLENQIPFKVLAILIDSSQAKVELNKSIKIFIQMNVMIPDYKPNDLDINIDKEETTHLLELLQNLAVRPHSKKEKWSKKLANYFPNGCRRNVHLGQISFRNVQELKAAGINFKPSKNCSLKGIDFTSLCFIGWLELPPLVVDDSTGPKLLNMIAYEMCPDNFRTDYEVSAYVSFLDSLVDSSNDVNDLRSAKILYNLLGSDEEVALLFNEIATELVPCLSFYNQVREKIQRHPGNRVETWMAEAYNTHFRSPWTILAFLGALMVLALTFVQTWYAINPPSENSRN
ncbi:hypothetical protein UlMin_005315 [Ulmus minor]